MGEEETTEQPRNLIKKMLDALRAFTPIPPADQRPKSITAEQYADLQNLTELAEIITERKDRGKKPAELPPITPEEAELYREILLKTLGKPSHSK